MKKFILAITAFSLVAGLSCSKFDDSAINGRLDDLEDRVGGLESEIEAINQKLDGFNNTLRGFTDVLNGGIITNVERNATNDGWVFTVQNVADLSTKSYEVKDGNKGDTGNDGNTPVLTTGYDSASGRYYWLIDGKEPNPRVWATGEKGEQGNTGATGGNGPKGDAGVTPQLAIAAASAADDSKPDFAAADDDDLYWWVSYDYPGTGDKSRYTWEKLYTANTTAVKLDLSVEYTDGELVFYNAGQEIGRAEVQLGTNPISITFQLNEEDFDAYGTIRFSKGSDNTLTVNVQGASENAVVKASLQNENGSFDIEIDDMEIYILANVTGATNKLLIDVLDGANCYHSWVNLATNIPAVTIPHAGVKHIAYNIAGTYEVEFTISLDMPAAEDMTFNFDYQEGDGATLGSNLAHPANATIKKGETSTVATATVTRMGLTAGTVYDQDYYYVSSENECIISYPFAEFSISDEPVKFDLTVSNFTCPFTSTLANICDGNLGTTFETNYSQSNFTESGAYRNYLSTIAEWGVYVDVTLPEPVYAIAFGYCHRSGTGRPANANGEIGAIRIGAQANNNYTEIGKVTVADDNLPTSTRTTGNNSFTQSESSQWKSAKTYSLNGTAFSAVRFGVVEAYAASNAASVGDSGYVDARQIPWVSVAINQLEVYGLY